MTIGWPDGRTSGRTTAAHAEWKQALAVVEKRIVLEPNHPELLHWKAHLQALTGQPGEAEQSWKLMGELMERPEGQEGFRYAEFHLALGRHKEAVQAVQLMRSSRRSSRSYDQASSLLYDPWLASRSGTIPRWRNSSPKRSSGCSRCGSNRRSARLPRRETRGPSDERRRVALRALSRGWSLVSRVKRLRAGSQALH
jgi:hypothetical protein